MTRYKFDAPYEQIYMAPGGMVFNGGSIVDLAGEPNDPRLVPVDSVPTEAPSETPAASPSAEQTSTDDDTSTTESDS